MCLMRPVVQMTAIVAICSIALPVWSGELAVPFEDPNSSYSTWVENREIDPDNDSEELLIIEYSGGANCCSDLTVVTRTKEGWKVLDFRWQVPGDNYFTDVDGDGIPELLTDRVYQVRGGQIIVKPCSKWVEQDGQLYCAG